MFSPRLLQAEVAAPAGRPQAASAPVGPVCRWVAPAPRCRPVVVRPEGLREALRGAPRGSKMPGDLPLLCLLSHRQRVADAAGQGWLKAMDAPAWPTWGRILGSSGLGAAPLGAALCPGGPKALGRAAIRQAGRVRSVVLEGNVVVRRVRGWQMAGRSALLVI